MTQIVTNQFLNPLISLFSTFHLPIDEICTERDKLIEQEGIDIEYLEEDSCFKSKVGGKFMCS